MEKDIGVTHEIHPSFRTKSGLCTVTPDQIVLTRVGLRGRFAELVLGSGTTRLLLTYAVLGIVLVGVGIYYLRQSKVVDAVIALAIGVLLLTNAFRSRRNTATPVIPRAAIQSIIATKPVAAMTRGYFAVEFLENARLVKRIIILPGILENGQAEYQKALEVFQSCGLPVSQAE